jgi:hypothetical protein
MKRIETADDLHTNYVRVEGTLVIEGARVKDGVRSTDAPDRHPTTHTGTQANTQTHTHTHTHTHTPSDGSWSPHLPRNLSLYRSLSLSATHTVFLILRF